MAPPTSARPRVLVVDDDDAVRRSLQRVLAADAFEVVAAADGDAGLRAVRTAAPDAVVLDVVMPGLDGVTVTRTLRARGHDLPVLLLTARDEVADRVAGLQAGADDYLVKPFAPEELVARLHALLRRRPEGVGLPFAVVDVRVDPRTRQAWRGERELALTRREFDLVSVLARHPGSVLSRRQLLAQVWGYGAEVEDNVVDLFVSYLRRKLEAGGEPRVLHTVRGVGFVLRA